MGDRLDALPKQTPFSTDSITSRIVWIDALKFATLFVADSLQSPEDQAAFLARSRRAPRAPSFAAACSI
jgi:hypothetical protein